MILLTGCGKMKKIMIIGCGGIGSFLIPLLNKVGLYDITVYDPDIVENKNLLYQNFENSDINLRKVDVMNKYETVNKIEPYLVLTKSQVQGYDLVICCADNLAVRKMLYKANVKWLDLRAQARNCALISGDVSPEIMETVLAGPDGSYSCQGQGWDGTPEEVNFMQVVAAGLGAQWVQNHFSGKDVDNHKVVYA